MRPVRRSRRCEYRSVSAMVDTVPPYTCAGSMPAACSRWRARANRSTFQCPGRVATKAASAAGSCPTKAWKTSSPIS
ncbi:hypothetical protein G6F40_018083 [Rhizopus arrhizus]|nr:hypothetical protein G6F40_018083 [Rhizopus arrhizus]